MDFSDKERLFIAEFLADPEANPVTAAKKSGYKRPRVEGKKLIERDDIQAEIRNQINKRLERLSIDKDYVLKRLIAIDMLDILDIIDKEDGYVIPIAEWPEVWRKCVTNFEVMEIRDKIEISGLVKKLRLPDKLKVLDMIGRHTAIQAWKDNIGIEGSLSGLDEFHKKRLDNE